MGLGMGYGGLGFGMELLLWVGEIRCEEPAGRVWARPWAHWQPCDGWADVGLGSAPVLGCGTGQGWGGSRAGVVAEIGLSAGLQRASRPPGVRHGTAGR
jgi:hypothetical protein